MRLIVKINNTLKKIFFIIIIFLFQQDLHSQKEIIGKVEFYNSEATEFALFRNTDNNYTKNLNKRKSKIQVSQRDSVIEINTDSYGIFKFSISPEYPIHIIVNKQSSVFYGKFEFNSYDIKDTLKLRISDKELAVRLDSRLEPDFQKKYSEYQARLDFENRKLNLLLMSMDWLKDEIRQRRKDITQTHNVEYIYISYPSQCKMRIMYRYNKVIRGLLGIKENVW